MSAPTPTQITFPRWSEPMYRSIKALNHSVFLLTGNVQDYPPGTPHSSLEGTVVAMMDAICGAAMSDPSFEVIPILVTQSGGFSLYKPSDLGKINNALLRQHLKEQSEAGVKNPDPDRAMQITNPAGMSFTQSMSAMNQLLKTDLEGLVLVISYAHLTQGKPSMGMGCNPLHLEMIQEWSRATRYRYVTVPTSDGPPKSVLKMCWTFLLAPNEGDVHPELSTCPTIYRVRVPLPDLQERHVRLNTYITDTTGKDLTLGCTVEQLARGSAGMTARDLESMVWSAAVSNNVLDQDWLAAAKLVTITDRYASVLTPIEPRIDFSAIGGHDHVKSFFHQMANLLNTKSTSGFSKYLTSGILLTGPAGTGKSVLLEAAAKELGFQMVRLDPDKTFDSLLGNSEKNMRAALECVVAMAPCLLFIDELDQAFQRGAIGDAGVSQRIFKMVLEFFANPENTKLGIIPVAATNRPSNVDPALMRAGRFGDVIPVLPPIGAAGRWEIVQALCRQRKLELQIDEAEGLEICGVDEDAPYTGAELWEVIASSMRKQIMRGNFDEILTPDILREGFKVVKPTTRDLRSWTAEAISFASNEEFIPEGYNTAAYTPMPVSVDNMELRRNPL